MNNWGYVEEVKLEELKRTAFELIGLETLYFCRKRRGPASGAGVRPPRGKDVQPHGTAGRGVQGVFPLYGGPVCDGGAEGKPTVLGCRVPQLCGQRPVGPGGPVRWRLSCVCCSPCRVPVRAARRHRALAVPGSRGLSATGRSLLALAQTLSLFCSVSGVMREVKCYPGPRAGGRKRDPGVPQQQGLTGPLSNAQADGLGEIPVDLFNWIKRSGPN